MSYLYCCSFMKKMIFHIYFITHIIGVLSIKTNVQNIRDIPIAENRSLEECINGKPYWESKSELYITTSQLIKKLGNPAEEHILLTEDGFLLTVHRIPGAAGASPVFLQPGAACSSFDYVVSGKDNALAFILADKGYDVWIGNSRGTTYSQCHTNFTTSEYRYWNFTWHEMGIYDLPTVIAYITNITNQDIMYIGHSMGTAVFYIMAIEKPDIATKVKAMFGLSCASYMSNIKSPLRLFAPFVRLFENLLRQVLYHMPAGVSIKALNFNLQQINSGRFQHYEYGREGNLRMYNNTKAPDYDLSKIKVPMAVFWVENGDIVSKMDALKLYEEVPNKIISYKIEAPIFYHMEFLWGKKAPKYLYPKLLSVMENYK